ncbi:MAG: serine/threonine protein kinase [Blautia sp.]|nr:serine/threonine protein kinase [Blautia sp.]
MKTEECNNISYKEWNVVRKIGFGSFGAVYEIQREDFGYLYKAALKVINIPQTEQDLSSIKNNLGKSEESLEVYYESVASEIVKEFELMYKLRGTTNIVSYEDHEVRKHKDGIGWEILIRMELLTSLDNYMYEHPMRREDIIRLGIDICKALERCRMFDIIHRDIKPGNIFVSEQKDFKLGDFGIARTIEAHNEILELSQKGTINYMAPEVYKGNNYSFNVDLYSLGMVLYRLLNNNVLPFVPQPPHKPTYKDIAAANQMRFSGKILEPPCRDHTQLSDVILKACAYSPKERYQSAKEMRQHLEMVLRGETIQEFAGTTVLLPPKTLPKRNLLSIRGLGKYITVILVVILLAVSAIVLGKRIVEKKELSADHQVVQETGEGESENGGVTENQTGGEDAGEGEKEKIKENSHDELLNLIEAHEFVDSYKMIQDAVNAKENLDEEIKLFVQACRTELEYKRIGAVMKLLTNQVRKNEAFYRETIQWFYDRNKEDLAFEIIEDIRKKGEEGEELANKLSQEHEQSKKEGE